MFKTILVPVDLSHPEQAKGAVQLAQRVGGEGSRIVAFYVAPDIPGFVAAQLPAGTLQKNLAEARAEITAIAEATGTDWEVRTGHPSTMILEYAEEIGADLIVIASHRPGLEDYFLGSTAARVVRHAACTVLVDR